jgi:hypothetical protein
MSDINAPAAPPSAPPAAPNPTPQVQHEVPIDTNQTSSPTPVSNQAPDKPPPTRREAIQAAFDRANKPREAPKTPPKTEAPKAAEAKTGHNQPPEPTESEGINLKKRPDEQPRDRGRFTRREVPSDTERNAPSDTERNAPGADLAKGTNGTQPASSNRTLPENTPFREPPQRMADHAKAAWADTPEPVRGEIHRMHQEFGNAYNQLKPIADAFQPIARFHQMAAQHGTTLERALTNYTSMEQKLRQDVVGGLDVIVNNLNLKSPDGQRLGLRDIAYHVLSQSPEALQQTQLGNSQTAAQHQIGALHQEINGLKQALHQMHTQQQFAYTRSQVDHFADSHPRFDELGVLIKNELDLGFDLETAYRRAELLKPATQAAQTRGDTPSAQTRPADRSISGSPGGVVASQAAAASRRSEKPVGRREAIANAITRVNGGR